MKRESVKRKLYSKMEKVGNIGMVSSLGVFGVSFLTTPNPLLFASASMLAITGTTLSMYGEKSKEKEDMKLGNYYIDNKTRKLTLKK